MADNNKLGTEMLHWIQCGQKSLVTYKRALPAEGWTTLLWSVEEVVVEKMETACKDNSFQKFGGEGKGSTKAVSEPKGAKGRCVFFRIEETWVCL